MKDFPHSSDKQPLAAQGRRDFISRSLLAGSSLLLAAETRANTPLTQRDEREITNTVGLADSIALYGGLLEDARRLVLQKDAKLIYIAKYEATEWLAHTTSEAERLRLILAQGTNLTEQQNQQLRTFLSDIEYGGKEIRNGLIRMRNEPLERIKNLDTDFDKIRADLAAASAALKNGNAGAAKENIVTAINQLKKYGALFSTGISSAPSTNEPSPRTPEQSTLQSATVPSSNLITLLQTVLDLLNSPPARPRSEHHAVALNDLVAPEPAFQASISSVLRSRLKPGTWLQVAIGYGVAFPILLRVSDRNNRLKLLNDALRMVPPGLRDPLLAELAGDLANLP